MPRLGAHSLDIPNHTHIIQIGFIYKFINLKAAASAAELQNSMDGRLDDSMLAFCGLAGLPVGPWRT